MALEAANQALTAANAAVQAAVKALALTRKQATKGAQRTGAIRSAASQARGRMTGRDSDKEATGVAPLAAATTRAKPAARAKSPAKAKPAAAARPKRAPKTKVTASGPAGEAAAPPPAPSTSESAFAQRKRSGRNAGNGAPPSPPRSGVRDAPLEVEALPAPGPETERQATTRPSGSAPIQLGPSSATSPASPAPAPPAEPATAPASDAPAPLPPTAPAVDPAEAARREAELAARESEIAEREAAMAQYAPMEPAHAVPARPPAEPNGLTVLVVDDEEQVRALTVRILSRFGYRVLEASGVEIAMSILDQRESEIDLVLSDVAMPGLSGKDLFRAISETRPGLPVVFMSGYALGVYAPEGLVEEGVKMLPKPFGQEDLLDFVTEALAGAGRMTG